MRKLVKGALVAAGLGAAAGAVHSLRHDEAVDVIAQKALKGAGEAATLGAMVGFVLDRREKKRRAKAKARFTSPFNATGLGDAARAARPALEAALEVLAHVAEQARPQVGHAVDVARPRVEQAVAAAIPKVESAAKATQKLASDAADRARAKVA